LRFNEIPRWVVYNDAGKKKINRRQRASKKLGVKKLPLNEVQQLFQARFIDNVHQGRIDEI